ncbi:AbiJ-NTD4 domain-containing protein [Acinetobacter defluvii]|uniref:AbiJ-NTD4 domain-containing protein n=1 Tax=Acinetobacter defluvii TaxID=1871111 RepID=UPI003AF7AA79
MRFSERYGYKPVREIIQKKSIDNDLKNSLWSLLQLSIFEKIKYANGQYDEVKKSNLEILIHSYWFHFFKKPIDNIPFSYSETLKNIRKAFFEMKWHEIYSFIEITLIFYPETVNSKQSFIQSVNNVLERECGAYRIINDDITPITSEQEIQSIGEALANTNPYSGVQQHLNQALKLMSDRQKPDYRNSIKEAISAVESICKIVTNDEKSTLGKALKIIEDKCGLHPALKGSLSQLYGYTSDGDGIRHAMLEESNLTYIDAKFMLVACTNFINYFIEKTK